MTINGVGWLKRQEVILSVPEARSSTSRCLQATLPLEAQGEKEPLCLFRLLVALRLWQRHSNLRSVFMWPSSRCLCVKFSLLSPKRILVTRFRVQMIPSRGPFLNFSCEDPIPKRGHAQRVWQTCNLGSAIRTTIQRVLSLTVKSCPSNPAFWSIQKCKGERVALEEAHPKA